LTIYWLAVVAQVELTLAAVVELVVLEHSQVKLFLLVLIQSLSAVAGQDHQALMEQAETRVL
jgi:hypothetical protein